MQDQSNLPDYEDDEYEDYITDEVRAFLNIPGTPPTTKIVPVDYTTPAEIPHDGRELAPIFQGGNLPPAEARIAVGCSQQIVGMGLAFAGFIALLIYLRGA